MGNVTVEKLLGHEIIFNDGTILTSEHRSDCCEEHYLSMSDLTLEDFEGLEFDLSNDDFFKRIPEYGIELIPVKGHSVKIPAYAENNGYYSDNLELVIKGDNYIKKYNITNCQDWSIN